MRIASPYTVSRRKDNGTWIFTINPTSGLPERVCLQWRRRSLEAIPPIPALEPFRDANSLAAAKILVSRFIDHLKEQLDGVTPLTAGGTTAGEWIEKFTSTTDNPAAENIKAGGRDYSPKTLKTYKSIYDTHIKGDPMLDLKMRSIEREDVTKFLGRMFDHKATKGKNAGQPIGGHRQYEALYKFVRMTFSVYQKTDASWRDPFVTIDGPGNSCEARGALEDEEVARLFTTPGVFKTEPALERAICAAMFWAGLRRGEIFALKDEDLDDKKGKIYVRRAWKDFDSPDRVIGKPKWDKVRIAIYPDILKSAIKEYHAERKKERARIEHGLSAEERKELKTIEYVFSRADGSMHGATWFDKHVKSWFARAGIDTTGRNITAHSARHSLASVLEAQGVSLRYIQEMLGHSDLKTTYGYLESPQDTVNRLTAAADKLSKG